MNLTSFLKIDTFGLFCSFWSKQQLKLGNGIKSMWFRVETMAQNHINLPCLHKGDLNPSNSLCLCSWTFCVLCLKHASTQVQVQVIRRRAKISTKPQGSLYCKAGLVSGNVYFSQSFALMFLHLCSLERFCGNCLCMTHS